jgi:parvulin-like peptidyl-prolyl isomerase
VTTRLPLAALLTLSPLLAAAAGTAVPPTPPAATAAAQAKAAPAAKRQVMYVYLTGEDGKARKVPLLAESSASVVVARAGDDVVTIRQLSLALSEAHQTFGDEAKAGGKDFTAMVNRLADVRLILREARDMGMYELPDVKASVESYRHMALLEALKRRALKGVTSDALEVERLYRDATKEWKVRSVLFAKEEDARELKAAVDAGKSFDVLATEAVAQRKAKGNEPGEFLPRERLLPAVRGTVEPMSSGAVSAPVRVQDGFAVLKVEGVRFPANPAKRAEVEATSRAGNQKRALAKYYDQLLKRYVTLDEKLLAKLDFEAAKPGIDALRKDRRAVARVRGASPVTVGDLATALQEQFFHGVPQAIQGKKVNEQKRPTLDALLSSRLVEVEGGRLGIPASAEFKQQLAEYRDSVVFNTFVGKVIVPDAKVSEEQERTYYDAHKGEFTYPAFYRLESMSFGTLKDAEAALAKLRSGTDFKWLKSNAEGQAKEPEVQFDATSVVAASAMPTDLAAVLNGARKGDQRLYASEKGQSHVIRVVDVAAPELQPFDAARPAIQKALFDEHMTQGIRDWSGKIRKVRPVKIFITRIGS